jgi:hypothetical protein
MLHFTGLDLFEKRNDEMYAECANILWKKVQRDELLKEEALLAARLLQGAASNAL